MTYPGETSRSTKTTGSGASYTEVLLTIGSDACVLAIPSNATPTLMLCAHGFNGSEQTINTTQMVATRDSMLASGVTLLASNATGNGWGNDASINALVAAWQWARTNLRTAATILHGQSMGGLIMANIVSRGLITDAICFVSIDGALNLDAVYKSSTTYAASIRTAYGIAADGSDYATKTAGHDPCLMSSSLFARWRIFLSASTADTSVSKVNNTDVFATRLGAQPKVLLQYTGNQEHVFPGNYFPAEVQAFANAALGAANLVKCWDQTGVRWIPAPVKVWTGTAWMPAPATRY